MQDFSWHPQGEHPASLVSLLYPALGIALGLLIGTAITSAPWEWRQATTRTELALSPAKVVGSPPPIITAPVTAPKKDTPLVILNPAAVETPPAPPAVSMKRAPPNVAASTVGGPGKTETSFPRPLASTETPRPDAPRDYRALRLQMLRGQ
jgi:hypothetical protein